MYPRPRRASLSPGAALLLSILCLTASAAFGQAPASEEDFGQCVPPPEDMVAWWALDETSGTVAGDLTGSHDGVHVNGPTPSAGYVDGALAFDGGNSVRVPDAADLDFGDCEDFSIDAWIRPDSTSGTQTILDKRTQDELGEGKIRGYHLFLFGEQLGLQLSSTSSSGFRNYLSTATVPAGAWTHVAATVDRDGSPGVRLYINGQVSGQFNVSGNTDIDNSSDLFLGQRSPDFGGDVRFQGEIDEVELFSRELLAQEVQALFDEGSFGKCKDTSTFCYLNDARFQVKVDWTDFAGNTGPGQAVPLTNDTCYFWFFDPANVEVTIKVLDGRGINQHWWVFYGALSNVEYVIKVVDTDTGAVKIYLNPLTNFASTGDTQAFPDIPDQFCGTRGTGPCPTGAYCDFHPTSQCGANDGGGTCRVPPVQCTFRGHKVCGCDGKTYDSSCFASMAGVAVASSGPC